MSVENVPCIRAGCDRYYTTVDPEMKPVKALLPGGWWVGPERQFWCPDHRDSSVSYQQWSARTVDDELDPATKRSIADGIAWQKEAENRVKAAAEKQHEAWTGLGPSGTESKHDPVSYGTERNKVMAQDVGVTLLSAFEPFAGGGMREPAGDRARFELLWPVGVPYDEQLLTRFARHMARGAAKYEDRNWEAFSDQAALERAQSSALRHIFQWLAGEDDEDHAAAVMFNLMAAEHVRRKLVTDAKAQVTEALKKDQQP